MQIVTIILASILEVSAVHEEESAIFLLQTHNSKDKAWAIC